MNKYLLLIPLLMFFSCHNSSVIKNQKNSPYTIRNDSVFFLNEFIPNVDLKSFEIIDSNYSRDANNIYGGEEIFAGVDVSTFKVLTDGYSKDCNCIYYLYNSKNKFCYADTRTFQIIDFGVCKDFRYVYVFNDQLQMTILKDADSKTFIKCGEFYYCDKNYLFAVSGEIMARKDTFDVEGFLRIVK